MKPFLSACLIVKDEEKLLRRCLQSIKGIADEIIIVDTGSTDKTKDIAKEYTKLVYDYLWEDNFSKARNFAASKASGDWIMAIDADEYVDRESFICFTKNLKESPPDSNILAVQIVNFIGPNGNSTVLNYHERIYKNDGTIYYYRNIHEMLKHKDSLEKKGISQLQIFHSGYMKDVVEEKNKAKRNLELLESIKEKEGYDYYFLGDVYYQLGDLDKAISNYKKAFQFKKSIEFDWVVKLLVKLINCLHAAKRNHEALEIIDASEKIYRNLVDFKFLRGQIHFNDGKENEAIKIFEDILSRKDQLEANFSIDYTEYLPHKYLGELYEKEKQINFAVYHYSKSLSINDSDDYVWMRLINLLANHSPLEDLVQFINDNCLNRKTMTPLRIIKVLLNIQNLNVQKLTRSYLNKAKFTPVEEEALLIKNHFLDKSTDEVLSMLNNKRVNDISLILSKGIFCISDLIVLTLETNDKNLKTTLYKLNFDESIENLLNMLFGKENKKLSPIEVNLFISTLKQANVMNMDKVIENLNKGHLGIEGIRKLNEELINFA